MSVFAFVPASMAVADLLFVFVYSNFDNSVQRIKQWVSDRLVTSGTSSPPTMSPSSSGAQMVGLGLAISAISAPGVTSDASGPNLSLSSGQRKRIKSFLKRCRLNPRHSQLNLEGYLLLPVQRIPRYRLLVSLHHPPDIYIPLPRLDFDALSTHNPPVTLH